MYVKTREHFYSCTKKGPSPSETFPFILSRMEMNVSERRKRASRKSFRVSTKSELGRVKDGRK